MTERKEEEQRVEERKRKRKRKEERSSLPSSSLSLDCRILANARIRPNTVS
jgi:hypothetical protein